ncbi:hypothetical protein Lalb_Chr24g0399951 [Lupinus albus]|uniref:Uncharacterized protein n=1 Tax=Lupinus albus TaxID=3870 RepID=A0A6A4NC34_LUPAL|nr:hypothetical protein Lalb_Chr24g0399951 [Lupinus albus]
MWFWMYILVYLVIKILRELKLPDPVSCLKKEMKGHLFVRTILVLLLKLFI